MTAQSETVTDPALPVPDLGETAKKRQILDGARRIFLENGFDGASMNDITRAAGVSKGTIYAYFPSKEALFEELIRQDKREQAESMTPITDENVLIREMLEVLGLRMLKALLTPESIARIRLVMGISPRFPSIGRTFYETGYAYGVEKLGACFARKQAQGLIDLDDAQEAARVFFDLSFSRPVRFALLGVMPAMSEAELTAMTKKAVAAFLKIYPAKDDPV
ncbi:TetR/AcrR family transcriptional regulator [Elstera sp.]|jgi:AcrR family transcriptional regulator|uniref:TetR/AcrR family transcriptional regulator n=1 Tax=Elstera sp. TaxID=1916664 RepID=UPI0037BFA57C